MTVPYANPLHLHMDNIDRSVRKHMAGLVKSS